MNRARLSGDPGCHIYIGVCHWAGVYINPHRRYSSTSEIYTCIIGGGGGADDGDGVPGPGSPPPHGFVTSIVPVRPPRNR